MPPCNNLVILHHPITDRHARMNIALLTSYWKTTTSVGTIFILFITITFNTTSKSFDFYTSSLTYSINPKWYTNGYARKSIIHLHSSVRIGKSLPSGFLFWRELGTASFPPKQEPSGRDFPIRTSLPCMILLVVHELYTRHMLQTIESN